MVSANHPSRKWPLARNQNPVSRRANGCNIYYTIERFERNFYSYSSLPSLCHTHFRCFHKFIFSRSWLALNYTLLHSKKLGFLRVCCCLLFASSSVRFILAAGLAKEVTLCFCVWLSSSDKTVKVWDAGSRQCVQTFYQHSDQVLI